MRRNSALYDKEKRPHLSHHYPEFDQCWNEKYRTPFMIVYDHEIIGFCFLRDTGIAYKIDEFFIRPLHRRRGFAQQAVSHIKEHCRRLGRHDVLAANIYVNNTPALSFWKSVGFKDTGRRQRLREIRLIETEADLTED